jgi:hypothetical protein
MTLPSSEHYGDSRDMEVEGETIVYEEVTLYYPRPNRSVAKARVEGQANQTAMPCSGPTEARHHVFLNWSRVYSQK